MNRGRLWHGRRTWGYAAASGACGGLQHPWARLLPPGCRATWTWNGRHDERWLRGLAALQALHVEFERLVVRCVCSTIMHPRCLVMWCKGQWPCDWC